MTYSNTPSSPLQACAQQWRVFGMMLVALARRVTMAHAQNARGEAVFAAMLEAQMYAALVQLSADIVRFGATGAKLSKADEDALTYLKRVHALLCVMALTIRQLRSNLEAAAEMQAALAGAPVAISAACPMAAHRPATAMAPP